MNVQLQRLYLDRNQLSSIDAKTFQGLSNLQELLLSNNKLNSIDANTSRGLSNLRDLIFIQIK